MEEHFLRENFWSALSITLLVSFFNLSLFIFLSFEESFLIYAAIVILNFVIFSVIFFLGVMGVNKILWKFWQSFPVSIHKIICIICLIWISLLSLKGLVPAIKKEYGKN